MRALVLAAGEGRRLRPFTAHTPKPLLTVANVPLLEHALALVRAAGIRSVGINVHTHAEQLRDFVGDGSRFDVEVTISEEAELLGTGGGIRQLLDRLPGDGPVLVVNADALCGRWDLREVIEAHRREGAAATLVLRPREDEAYTPVWREPSGWIAGIGGQSSAGSEPCVFTGIHVLEPRLIAALESGRPACLIRDCYWPALAAGDRFASVLFEGFWSDVGTPERLLSTNLEVLRRGVDLPAGTRGRFEVGVGLVANEAILAAEASVGPEVVIGPGVTIAGPAEVRRCVLLTGARVEAGEHLEGAVRGEHAEWKGRTG